MTSAFSLQSIGCRIIQQTFFSDSVSSDAAVVVETMPVEPDGLPTGPVPLKAAVRPGKNVVDPYPVHPRCRPDNWSE